jgi:L-alanine-DL-glutamate epimerase-like enolase superfamily enzyme
MPPAITRIETVEFEYPVEQTGTTPGGFGPVYDPSGTNTFQQYGIRIETDAGITGEYVGGSSPGLAQVNMVADYLIGKNPLNRERHWSEMKRALRKYDRMGIGPLDIALWDVAGKYRGAPIHELLGTYRERLPAYASTYPADLNGGLDSPGAFADFAAECRDVGYSGFKIHVWGGDWRDVDRVVETVHAVGERAGDGMDLMLDPACNLHTFADALRVGDACDEQGYFWYEDPYFDGGLSQHGHRKLRQQLDTPILQTEHVRGLEPHTDFAATESTDFLRADPEYDAGITGTMKIARMAEGFGLDVELHAPGPAQRHCMAAIRNTNYYEIALVHPDCGNFLSRTPAHAGDYSDELDAVDDDGTVPVPDDPGLGVEYDWAYVEANATGRRVYE